VPAPGFEVHDGIPGPGTEVEVRFRNDSTDAEVRMIIRFDNGMPVYSLKHKPGTNFDVGEYYVIRRPARG
jgi:hypothetical protein